MKGRGVRIIDDDDLRIVTPDATAKDHFVLVDAVGVTETKLQDTVPLERKHGVGFDKLLNQIGLGNTDEEVVSSVASRLARLDKRISQPERAEIEQVAGLSLAEISHRLVDALDPDHHIAAAQTATGSTDPTPEQIAAARKSLVEAAVEPMAGNAELREKLVEVRRSYEQVIDVMSKDRAISGDFSTDATDRARTTIDSFREFIDDHKDEITALQILYNQPYGGGLTFADIRELANAIERPPRSWTPDLLWQAYEALDASKVRGSGHRVNTDLVSLVRYALGNTDELVAYPDLVNERFDAWLLQQDNAGRTFTDDQLTYLRMVKDHLAASLTIAPRDLTEAPFSEHGGLGRARQLFGDDLNPLLRRTDTGARCMNLDLPAGWEWVSFGDAADTQLGKMLSNKSRTGVGSRPYLRNQNVQWHRFDLDDVAEMDFTNDETVKYDLQTGDLLVVRGWRGWSMRDVDPACRRDALPEGPSQSPSTKRSSWQMARVLPALGS